MALQCPLNSKCYVQLFQDSITEVLI